MACGSQTGVGGYTTVITNSGCVDKFGCGDVCPDFVIKRHDTKPSFKVSVSDCDGALDLTSENLILEVNIWAKAKLKTAIEADDTYFALADNIGFEQVMVGDIIIMDRVRLPEQMLVIGFDEINYLIQVERGYQGTTASAWKKGNGMKIFRALNSSAEIETTLEDITQEDGTVLTDQITETFLVYNFLASDTCLPGCYSVEFKLIMMTDSDLITTLPPLAITPSFTPSTLSVADFGCTMSDSIDWIRRFPSESEGFIIKIIDSPTQE